MKELLQTPEIVYSVQALGLLALTMAFNTRIRNWWMRVSDGKCQYEIYSEKDGFKDCGERAKHVHHIRPEGWTKDRGGDPDHNVGMGLCENHHVRNRGTEEYSDDFSFHPDIGSAYQSYREWKLQQQHLNSINGKRTIDYSTSPFTEVSAKHREMSANDERYWSGTEELDDYYEQKMRDKATRYIATTGEKKPVKRNEKI